MRIPLYKPWRAFEQFDDLSDAECERHVVEAIINYPWLGRVPVILGVLTFVAWPTTWVILAELGLISRWIPVARSTEWIGIQLIITTIFATALVYWVTRDFAVWIGLRRSLLRGCCPKCRQSLEGLPVQSMGVEHDPASQWVRCPECGKKVMLLEHGITPRDLVPWELRRPDPNLARLRENESWKGRK